METIELKGQFKGVNLEIKNQDEYNPIYYHTNLLGEESVDIGAAYIDKYINDFKTSFFNQNKITRDGDTYTLRLFIPDIRDFKPYFDNEYDIEDAEYNSNYLCLDLKYNSFSVRLYYNSCKEKSDYIFDIDIESNITVAYKPSMFPTYSFSHRNRCNTFKEVQEIIVNYQKEYYNNFFNI